MGFISWLLLDVVISVVLVSGRNYEVYKGGSVTIECPHPNEGFDCDPDINPVCGHLKVLSESDPGPATYAFWYTDVELNRIGLFPKAKKDPTISDTPIYYEPFTQDNAELYSNGSLGILSAEGVFARNYSCHINFALQLHDRIGDNICLNVIDPEEGLTYTCNGDTIQNVITNEPEMVSTSDRPQSGSNHGNTPSNDDDDDDDRGDDEEINELNTELIIILVSVICCVLILIIIGVVCVYRKSRSRVQESPIYGISSQVSTESTNQLMDNIISSSQSPAITVNKPDHIYAKIDESVTRNNSVAKPAETNEVTSEIKNEYENDIKGNNEDGNHNIYVTDIIV